jgi:hypothetical protein
MMLKPLAGHDFTVQTTTTETAAHLIFSLCCSLAPASPSRDTHTQADFSSKRQP